MACLLERHHSARLLLSFSQYFQESRLGYGRNIHIQEPQRFSLRHMWRSGHTASSVAWSRSILCRGFWAPAWKSLAGL